MTFENLLGLGYLCEEMPPCFTSQLLGEKSVTLYAKTSSIPYSREGYNCVKFSAPNKGIHRRLFSIPHPLPQIKISKLIADKWAEISLQYTKSENSISKPEIDNNSTRAIVYLSKYEKFREACIIASSTKRYQLHLDIAKYFYSIYTHSIPWAIHTRATAKANKRDLTLWGNEIDYLLMMSQNFQTKGIPVGTDTSRIIAEILGCTIDEEFYNALKSFSIELSGFRFVDDCKFFFDSLRDAELALDQYHKILTSYGLNLNEEKTIIECSPCIYDNSWKLPLNAAPLEYKLDKNQRTDLKNYFNLLICTSKNHPNEPVIKYGIKRINKLSIHRNNIEIFESLLYCVSLHEPSILPFTCELLHKYSHGISKANLTNFVNVLIEQNVHKGHHFEVSWGLWIAKQFNVIISSTNADKIINSRDISSIIILLDLKNSKKIDGDVDTTDLERDLDLTSLDNEFWLLAYESEYHNWLPLNNIRKHNFFKLLQDEKITFYNIEATNNRSKSKSLTQKKKQKAKMVEVSFEYN